MKIPEDLTREPATAGGRTAILEAIDLSRHLLPDQGPIDVFIHHNTLHGLQHLPFHEAVEQGAMKLGARPYPELSFFQKALKDGRIRKEDLDAEILNHLGPRGEDLILKGCLRKDLWRLLLLEAPDLISERDLAFSAGLTADSRVCKIGALNPLPALSAPDPNGSLRRILRAAGLDDITMEVDRELIRLCAGFLDRGMSALPMPDRKLGFLASALGLLETLPAPANFRGLREDLRLLRQQTPSPDAHAVILHCLERQKVPASGYSPRIQLTLFALPGWAGMFSRLEQHPEESQGLPVRLEDYLAVRLILETRALENAWTESATGTRTGNADFSWEEILRLSALNSDDDLRPLAMAHLLERLAGAAEIESTDLEALKPNDIATLQQAVQEADPILRRRIWQEAYERKYRTDIFEALHARRRIPGQAQPAASAHLLFCIDEREESLRRALEEVDPSIRTEGLAGFFGIAMNYQGNEDSHPAPYCPAVVTPQHLVFELPRSGEKGIDELRKHRMSFLHELEWVAARLSRTFGGGALASLFLGPLLGLLAFVRIYSPRKSLERARLLEAWWAPAPSTELTSMQSVRNPGPIASGFTLLEAADRIEAQLRNIGLISNFPPLVGLLGHGSTSLNNPHESAHDCGACGGRRGGANARIFADLANRTEIRELLRTRGIDIPDRTWFVGGIHDTSDDRIDWSDIERIPEGPTRSAFERLQCSLLEARKLNAFERARRFETLPLSATPAEALLHVQTRAAHLAQPRPEYGHCTNASAIVGRRALTRGLHLDRRAFLISYDPLLDDSHGPILERILAAVGPVGAGINLEYYFSSVDNEVFGCGTKLPHNVTGLIGVMNGHLSDLRTGLPWQMVEIHEPMRLLLCVEATPETLLGIAARQPEVRELVTGEWVRLASIDPSDGRIHFFRNGEFQFQESRNLPLASIPCSLDWNRKTREHLPPALIQGAPL